MTSDIRARRKPSDWRRERRTNPPLHGTVVAPGGLGGCGGRVSLSLDSDREVLKLYIRLFDVNSGINCVVAFH